MGHSRNGRLPRAKRGQKAYDSGRLVPRRLLKHNSPMTFTRITIDPAICTGKPCIRGLRFPVARLLGLLASGEIREQILKAYPYLESDDIDEALRYAASLAEDETIDLVPMG